MILARLRIGTQTLLCRIEGDGAHPLQLDSELNWADPFREYVDGGGVEIASATLSMTSATLLAPLRAPSKIVNISLNYRDRAEQTGQDLPDAPLLFSKAPSSIVGTDAEIAVPSGFEDVDFEGELAVVIGRPMKNVDESDALDHVFGYTVANDVSSRAAQRQDGQYFRAKSADTFCPLGPFIVTTDEIGDVQSLRIRTEVNGELRQDGTTADMVFSVAESLAYISRFMTLEPGDIVLTGTPAGDGASVTPPRYLSDGDQVSITIDGIGTLSNTVRFAP